MARRPKTPCPNCIHGVKRCGRHQRPSNPHAPTRLRLASEKAAEPEAKNQSRATSAKRESVLRNSELSAPLIRQTILPRTTSPVHHRTTLMMMIPTDHLQSASVLVNKPALLRKRQLPRIQALKNSLLSWRPSKILQSIPPRILQTVPPRILQTIPPTILSPQSHRMTLMMTPIHHLQSALVWVKKLALLWKKQPLVKTTFQHRLPIPGTTCY
jgi:hypothetical protein